MEGQILISGKKNDQGKLRFDLLPPMPLEELVFVYTLGSRKYADRNWEGGIKWGRVFAAMMRHSWAFWRGETFDRECLNAECNDENGKHTYLPAEAAQNRGTACPKCGVGGMRQYHLASVAWCALALLQYSETHTEFDDRATVVNP